MINKIITLILISIAFNVYCQQNNYSTTKIIPPSPTAAALGAYGDIPIGYFTGQPSVSIPLYQIKTNQHQLDIDLSYNSNIRVNQDASWVGLGWSLNAGGVVTRTVRGLDDFDNMSYGATGVGYYYAAPLLKPDYLPEDNPTDEELYKTVHSNDKNGTNDPIAIYYREASEGRTDLEPDIFYYNFAGYSGSFVLGKKAEGSVVYQKKENGLKIEILFATSNQPWGQWKMTTPEGYIYSFATIEASEDVHTDNINLKELELKGLGPYVGTSIDNPYGGSNAFRRANRLTANTWYLDYIEAPNGERINFNYRKPGKTLSNINIFEKRYDIFNQSQTWGPPNYTKDYFGNIICEDEQVYLQNVYDYTYASRQIIDEIVLENITFNGGRIDFVSNYSADKRKDVETFDGGNGGRKLSQILVYDENNTAIKSFDLNHNYFNSSYMNSTGNNLAYTMCRLKLESVTEFGKSPWKFEYYDSDSMPSKYTKRVDKWGYSNPYIQEKAIGGIYYSGGSSTTWLPEVVHNGKTYEGTTRITDSSGMFSKCGVIKKMTYPTGGYTSFDFEPNQKYIMPKQIEIYSSIASARNEGNLDENEDIYEDTFHISTRKNYDLVFIAGPTYALIPISPTEPIAWLKDGSGNVLETFYLTDPEKTVVQGDRILDVGNYKLVVAPIYDHMVYLDLYGKQTTTSTVTTEALGGLRISKICNYDFTGNKLNTKKYIYTNDGTIEGKSSGFLMSEIKDYEIRSETANRLITCNTGLNGAYWDFGASAVFLYRSSNSLYSLGFNTPSAITGYSKVYEMSDENGQSGMTSYEFRSTLDFKSYNYGPVMSTLNLGDVANVKKYTSGGNLVEENDTSFKIKKLKYLLGINLDKLKSFLDPCPACFLSTLSEDKIPYYVNWSEWYVADQVTKTQYNTEGNIVTVDSFNYDSPYHTQITSKTSETSGGITLQTNYKYPHDFAATAPYNAMVAKNIISPVIETQTYRDTNKDRITQANELLGIERTNYKDWSGNLILPESVQSSKGINPLETRVEYLSYYPNGNVKEVSQKDGTHIIYIWGYNDQYPVAKVENVSEAQIMALNLDMGTLNSYYTTESSKRAVLQVLRDGLPQALVTTYTYKPLVGIASITDPKGSTLYYQYDSANRLKYVKDQDGKVIFSNRYHYKNQ